MLTAIWDSDLARVFQMLLYTALAIVLLYLQHERHMLFVFSLVIPQYTQHSPTSFGLLIMCFFF